MSNSWRGFLKAEAVGRTFHEGNIFVVAWVKPVASADCAALEPHDARL
jgi:hypothetical protein